MNMVRLLTIKVIGCIFLVSAPAVNIFATGDPDCPGGDAAEVAEGPNSNPTGIAGMFNGAITTGCSYDIFNKNARREVTDIFVPGCVGAYPLKFTRTYNSALGTSLGMEYMGHGWRYSYGWTYNEVVLASPDGRDINDGAPLEEYWVSPYNRDTWVLPDGGKVHLGHDWGASCTIIDQCRVHSADQIIDPYGQITTIETTPNNITDNRITKVTEPGGKYLAFTYYTANDQVPSAVVGMLKKVEAFTPANQSLGLSATYTYTTTGRLSVVAYNDGTSAYYDGDDSVTRSFNDVRYDGPMRKLKYNSGSFVSELNYTTEEPVSTVDKVDGKKRETRGDGATRTFTYIAEGTVCHPGEFDGFLKEYTDFKGNITKIDYETEDVYHIGYIKSVTDGRNNPTQYVRGYNESWAITKIIYPDGSFVEQEFTDHTLPMYLASRTALRKTGDAAYTTSYVRDSNHRITEIHYPDSSAEFFTYDDSTNPLGQITKHQLKNGAFVHFVYNSRHLLVKKTNPTAHSTFQEDDPRTTYVYYPDDPSSTVAWTDRVYQETDPMGNTTTYEYDRAFVSCVTNPTGSPIASRGMVTKIIHPGNKTESFGYNVYGDKLWQTNELGKTTNYEYDEYGRVTAVKTPLPTGQATTSYSYIPATEGATSSSPLCHTTNNPQSVTTATGVVTTNTYDKNWRKSSVAIGQGTNAATTRFAYDAVGNQTKVTDPRGDANMNTFTMVSTYDSLNRLETVTDPQSHILTNHYDSRGRLERITRPDSTEELKTFDTMNRVLTDTVPQNSSTSITTTFTYDPSGTIHTLKDGKDQVTTFEYDSSDAKTRMVYPNGTEDQTWTFDANHNLIARKTVSGVAQQFSYDARNRQIGMAWSDGADWATFGYDDVGRLTSAINPTSTVTRQYDDGGRMTHDIQQMHVYPVSAVSRKTHSSAGTFDIVLPLSGPTGIECRKGQGTNSSDHQIVITFSRAVTLSGASITTGTGTVAGTPGVSADGKAVTVNLTGVANEQTIVLTLSAVSDGETTNDVLIGATFLLGDSTANNIVNASDSGQVSGQIGQTVTTSNFRQDVNVNGSISSSDVSIISPKIGTGATGTAPTQPGTTTNPAIDVQYGYDDEGKQNHLSVTTANAGYDYSFAYDTLGRLEKISTGSTQLFQYFYEDKVNETKRLNVQSNVAQIYGRDSLNRMTQRDVKNGTANPVSTEVYSYEPNRPGLLTSVDRTDTGTLKRDAFGYDLLPELTSAQYGMVQSGQNWITPQQTCGYVFDKAGNRSSMTDSLGANCTYGVTNLNQYWTDGTNAIGSGAQHEISNYQNLTYKYINDTHLSQVSGTDLFNQQSTYQMSYDALGRCAVRVMNGVTTSYIYDGEKPILEYKTWSAPSAKNLYGKGIDEILLRYDPNTTPSTVYYQEDHEGSVTHLTDSNGAVLERYTYDAFGKPTIFNSTSQPINISTFKNRFLFTGREYVAEFGIYEYRNRAYHPGLGRFMSEDPKGFDAGDNNFFRYVGNDPLDRVDPMGLADEIKTGKVVVDHLSATDIQSLWDRIERGMPLTMGQTAAVIEQKAKAPVFRSRGAAEKAAADSCVNLAKNDKARIPSERREWKRDIGQSDNDPDIYTYGPAHRGGYERVKGKNGWYNVSVIGAPDLPDGFHRVGIVWAFPHHTDHWEKGDRYTLWSDHLHGVLGSPPVKGATGAWNKNNYLHYEYKLNSEPPEPPPPY